MEHLKDSSYSGWNDEVSSVKVSPGCFFLGYADPKFSKDIYPTNKDNVNGLTYEGWSADSYWDNTMSGYTCQCVKVCAILYEHKKYNAGKAGSLIPIPDGENVPDVRQTYKGWNDKVSSVKIKEGCKLEMYAHPNFSGKMGDYYHRNSDTLPSSEEDEMTSFKCTCTY